MKTLIWTMFNFHPFQWSLAFYLDSDNNYKINVRTDSEMTDDQLDILRDARNTVIPQVFEEAQETITDLFISMDRQLRKNKKPKPQKRLF